MELLLCVCILITAAIIISIAGSPNMRENMSGYGSVSGLYFNNNSSHCFKNMYDPPDFEGYCTTIGTVVR